MEEVVSFTLNGHALYAVCHAPQGRRTGVGILTVPGYRAGTSRYLVSAARLLAQNGHAVMRCDLSGYGDSAGFLPAGRKYTEQDHARHLAETNLACRIFRERLGPERIVLLGKCWGGRYALGASVECAGVDGLILLSVPLWSDEARLRWLAQTDQKTIWSKLRNWERWKVVFSSWEEFRGELHRLASVLQGLRNGHRDTEADRYFFEVLVKFLDSGRRILAFYGRDDEITPVFLHLVEDDPRMRQHVRSGNLQYEIYANADHDFTSGDVRQLVLERSLIWLEETRQARQLQ